MESSVNTMRSRIKRVRCTRTLCVGDPIIRLAYLSIENDDLRKATLVTFSTKSDQWADAIGAVDVVGAVDVSGRSNKVE